MTDRIREMQRILNKFKLEDEHWRGSPCISGIDWLLAEVHGLQSLLAGKDREIRSWKQHDKYSTEIIRGLEDDLESEKAKLRYYAGGSDD